MALAEPIARRGDWQRSGRRQQRETWICATKAAAVDTQNGNHRHKPGGDGEMTRGGGRTLCGRRCGRLPDCPHGNLCRSTRTAAARTTPAGDLERDDRQRWAPKTMFTKI